MNGYAELLKACEAVERETGIHDMVHVRRGMLLSFLDLAKRREKELEEQCANWKDLVNQIIGLVEDSGDVTLIGPSGHTWESLRLRADQLAGSPMKG